MSSARIKRVDSTVQPFYKSHPCKGTKLAIRGGLYIQLQYPGDPEISLYIVSAPAHQTYERSFHILASTKSLNNVDLTLSQRFDVESTLNRRCFNVVACWDAWLIVLFIYLFFQQCCDSGKTCESYIYKGCTWWKCVPGKYIPHLLYLNIRTVSTTLLKWTTRSWHDYRLFPFVRKSAGIEPIPLVCNRSWIVLIPTSVCEKLKTHYLLQLLDQL